MARAFVLPLLLVLTAPAVADPAPGNVARGRRVSRLGVSGSPRSVTDRIVAREGAPAASIPSATLPRHGARLQIDLVSPRRLAGLFVQRAGSGRLVVSGSLDEASWWPVAELSAATLEGLRTEAVTVPAGGDVRFLRLEAAGGPVTVSELQAYEVLPAPWPPALSAWKPESRPRHGLSRDDLSLVKAALAGLAATFLLVAARRPARSRATRNAFLALGLVGFTGFWNWGGFHLDHFVHIWDFTHYYLAGKYSRELGYGRLYQCMSAVEVELRAGNDVRGRLRRDLATNTYALVTDPDADWRECRTVFGPAWPAFVRDATVLRHRAGASRFADMQLDHGYNGTPVWALTGGLVARTAPASATQVLVLASLDSVLLVVAFGAIVWAFGATEAAVAALYLGLNGAADFGWIGGSFLRFDWLALTVAAVCLQKKGRPGLAGALLAWASLLRIFPVLLFVGPFLKEVVEMVRQGRRRPSAPFVRLATGALVATVALVSLSATTSPRGIRVWSDFVANSKKHLSSPSQQNVGLRTLLSYAPDRVAAIPTGEDAARAWWGPHERAWQARRWLLPIVTIAFLALLTAAASRVDVWAAMVLASCLVPLLTTVSCYYYTFPLLLGLLWRESPLPGALAVALAGLSCAFALAAPDDYHAYTLFSAALVAVAFAAAAAFVPALSRSSTPAAR